MFIGSLSICSSDDAEAMRSYDYNLNSMVSVDNFRNWTVGRETELVASAPQNFYV
jgi:hypothetical protein